MKKRAESINILISVATVFFLFLLLYLAYKIYSASNVPGVAIDQWKTSIPKAQNNNFPPDVAALLKQNNIDLYYLRSIKNIGIPELSGASSQFTYDTKPTGYVFKLTSPAKTDELGITHISFNVEYNSLPIFTRELNISFRPGRTPFSTGMDLKDISISPTPVISESSASVKAALEQPALSGIKPELGYFDKNAGSSDQQEHSLVWRITNGRAYVIIDAKSGITIRSYNGIIMN